MKWININNASLYDKPRKLTKEEINYIIDDFPLSKGEAGMTAREGVVAWLVKNLEKMELAPSALGELKSKILEQHYKSLVIPGTPVGIVAAEALGATTTQMTLNTFHASGSARSVSFGIDTMKDILFARKNTKNSYCTIYYKNKLMTLEEVLDTKSYIVGSLFNVFIKDYKIGKFNKSSDQVLEKNYWNEKSFVETFMDNINYPSNIDDIIILRIYLNVNEMYKNKVSLYQLAQLINLQDTHIFSLYGSISDGIIDVIPNVKITTDHIEILDKRTNPVSELNIDELQTYIESLFFETFMETLVNITVKGLERITNLQPKVINVWKIVEEEISINKSTNEWDLILNKRVMKITGLTSLNLLNMLNKFDIKIIDKTPNNIRISLPTDITTNPENYISNLLSIDKNSYRDNKILHRSDRVKSSEFVIALTEGENLSGLLSLPQIDKTRTTCNNMFVVSEIFGIEAARNLIIKELTEVTEKSYINPANIMFIAEFITSRGEPNGATYTGISRQPGGHLSLATLERAGNVFTQSALFGSKEDIRNVSASVSVGARMAIGDGMFDIGLDVDGKTYINNDIFILKTNIIPPPISNVNILDSDIYLQKDITPNIILTNALIFEKIIIYPLNEYNNPFLSTLGFLCETTQQNVVKTMSKPTKKLALIMK
jgi:DNA-directed RNA polymerase beta' subunit